MEWKCAQKFWMIFKDNLLSSSAKKWSCCAGRRNFSRIFNWLQEHLLDETRFKKGTYKRMTWGTVHISWKNWPVGLQHHCLWQLSRLGKSPMSGRSLTPHVSLERQESELGNYLQITIISITRRSGKVSILVSTLKAIKDKNLVGSKSYGLTANRIWLTSLLSKMKLLYVWRWKCWLQCALWGFDTIPHDIIWKLRGCELKKQVERGTENCLVMSDQ